jgi:hypothetical protein
MATEVIEKQHTLEDARKVVREECDRVLNLYLDDKLTFTAEQNSALYHVNSQSIYHSKLRHSHFSFP